MRDYHEIDWPAEEYALAAYLQSRDLTLHQIASLLEFTLAEAVGTLSRDPAEAEAAMERILRRSQPIAAECCRAMRPAPNS